MKLTKDQKAERKELIAALNEAGGMLFTSGGVTVAVSCHLKTDNTPGDFVTYGASYCNPCDKFKRKYGEYLALLRFFEASDSACGENQLRMRPGEDEEEFVKRVFFNSTEQWPFPKDE